MQKLKIIFWGLILFVLSEACTSSEKLYIYEFKPSEYEEPLVYIFFDHAPPRSAEVKQCLTSEQKEGKNFNKIYACSIVIKPSEFNSLLKGIIDVKGEDSLKCYPTSKINLDI